MKALSALLLLAACMAFVLAGCSDNSGPVATPTSSTEHAVPHLGKTDGSGAWVYSYGINTFAFFLDPNSGWFLLLGVNDGSDFCAGAGGLDRFSITDIFLPNADAIEFRRNIFKLAGRDLTAMAWRRTAPPGPLCAFLQANPPDATGIANFMLVDNDNYVYVQDNPNSNAWGAKANGTLTTPDGQVYKVNLVLRVSWDGADALQHQTIVYKVQMTPTGKY